MGIYHIGDTLFLGKVEMWSARGKLSGQNHRFKTILYSPKDKRHRLVFYVETGPGITTLALDDAMNLAREWADSEGSYPTFEQARKESGWSEESFPRKTHRMVYNYARSLYIRLNCFLGNELFEALLAGRYQNARRREPKEHCNSLHKDK